MYEIALRGSISVDATTENVESIPGTAVKEAGCCIIIVAMTIIYSA